MPGCEKWEAIDEKTIDSIVVAKVGPISARFKFTTTFIEMNPPTHLKAVGKGDDLHKNATFSQETTVDLKEISKEEVEVSSMIPLLMGLRYNVLRLRNPSAIQPYVTFGGGPYWLFDISARDEWGLNEEVAIKSKTLAGVYGGGGMYFNIASWLAFNFDIKYHFINFDPNHDYSGFEFGMGFGILWGRYTPNG